MGAKPMLCSHCEMQGQPPERRLLGAWLMHGSCTVLMHWSGTVLHAGSRVSCSFCSGLSQPCQPQWAFVFTGRFNLWRDKSVGKLHKNLVCSGNGLCTFQAVY